jgi:nickel-dependent lactate racemase
MKVDFAFGRAGLEVELPGEYLYSVLEARSAMPLSDVTAALDLALDHPIGCAPLKELARGRKSAAISVCDVTRPVPNQVTLPPLLERLHKGGITVEDITILLATGLHRPATAEEIRAIVGPEIASRYRVVNHDARSLAEHRSLGQTRRGTPVFIDERFMAADLHITLGLIEQHLMLGFSGGRKLIAPGLAAQESIKTIHSPRFMREVMATEGSIDENPLHDELLEIAHMARHDFMLDVALARNREIAGVFAGDPVRAHAAGVDFVKRSMQIDIPDCVDGAITSAAGYPLDLTFYQTIKGVTAAQHIVKPGGRILVLSECAEGVGSAEFGEKLRTVGSYQSYLDQIESSQVEVDQWQLEKLALTGLRNDVLFYVPGVPASAMGALEEKRFHNIDAALVAFFQGVPRDAQIAVIPDGPYAYARAGNAEVGIAGVIRSTPVSERLSYKR